MENGQVLQVF